MTDWTNESDFNLKRLLLKPCLGSFFRFLLGNIMNAQKNYQPSVVAKFWFMDESNEEL